MYSWGNDTSTWRGPGRYNFDSARRGYLDDLAQSAAAKGPRSYTAPPGPDLGLVDPHGKRIHSDKKNPVIVAVDVTGSMAAWPGEIFDRLPLLYQTLSQYRDDVEISFCAIGDANSDRYPLQINEFASGVALEDHLKALYPEGGGGGQSRESYELFGYHVLQNAQTPNATSPFLIMFGDEGFYDTVDPDQAE
ncbi:MAG: hypothetical protein ACOCWQ_00750, partial [Nanoarchaeota archaeon]